MLNNGDNGQVETDASLLGPFWRMHSPPTENGGSIVRSPTPGEAMFVNAQFVDKAGKPIAGAEVDIWHSSTEGFYENQDPVQADMNLRGKFTTDKDGRIAFRSIKPAGYPIPIDGPTGDLLRAQGRHNMRPAHLHFLTTKDGFKTLISQIYVQDDKFIDTDVQFGVTRKLIGNYVRHENEPAPAADVKGAWYSLDYTFTMERGHDQASARADIRQSDRASGRRFRIWREAGAQYPHSGLLGGSRSLIESHGRPLSPTQARWRVGRRDGAEMKQGGAFGTYTLAPNIFGGSWIPAARSSASLLARCECSRVLLPSMYAAISISFLIQGPGRRAYTLLILQ